MLLPLTPEVNVIIAIIYISSSFVAFQCYPPGLDADVISWVFDDAVCCTPPHPPVLSQDWFKGGGELRNFTNLSKI